MKTTLILLTSAAIAYAIVKAAKKKKVEPKMMFV